MPRAGLDPEAVVAAGAALADADGLAALTLARLASALGVRSPSLYAHVGGLEDLRERIAARGARELAVALSAAATGRSRRDALHAVTGAYRAFAGEHPGVYAALQRPTADPGGESAAAATQLVEVLVAVLRGYGLEGEDAIHGVRIVRAALHGFVSLEREGGFQMAVSLEETYERLIGMLDAGLGAGQVDGATAMTSPALPARGGILRG
jgi:AcrR family transcriptional regulator